MTQPSHKHPGIWRAGVGPARLRGPLAGAGAGQKGDDTAARSSPPLMDERVWHALLLTGMGAAGTALGGLMVVAQPKMQFKRLGYLQASPGGTGRDDRRVARDGAGLACCGRAAHWQANPVRATPHTHSASRHGRTMPHAQGLAAGLMLCISMFDLMPAAVAEVGFAAANAWFFAGVLFFAVVVHLIPEPSSEGLVIDDEEPAPAKGAKAAAGHSGKAAAPTPEKLTQRRMSTRCGAVQWLQRGHAHGQVHAHSRGAAS